MSYLHTPRLVFSGDFLSDVSTVNNDPALYTSRAFKPSFRDGGMIGHLVKGAESRAAGKMTDQSNARFKGNTGQHSNTSGLMFDIKLYAEKLCGTPFPGEEGVFIGPAFEFIKAGK
jgi:hypothetical protein